MSQADLIGLLVFAGSAALILIAVPLLGLRRQRQEFLRKRLTLALGGSAPELAALKEDERLFRPEVMVRSRILWFNSLLEELDQQFALAGGVRILPQVILVGLIFAFISFVACRIYFFWSWGTSMALSGAVLVLAAYSLLAFLDRRKKMAFLKQFPVAIDLVIRAVQAGIPVNEAIQNIAKEVPNPVGREFKTIADKLVIGVPFEEVLETAMKRLQLVEFRFFAVALMLQRETGGQLSETLGNLALVLRKRQELKLKVRALTSEARAGAYIITAIPFLTITALYFIRPDLVNLLFFDETGKKILAYAASSVLLGLIIIRFLMHRVEKK
ncbi:type II secretion system F family protein [Rhodovibrionaceae bacterium A322]